MVVPADARGARAATMRRPSFETTQWSASAGLVAIGRALEQRLVDQAVDHGRDRGVGVDQRIQVRRLAVQVDAQRTAGPRDVRWRRRPARAARRSRAASPSPAAVRARRAGAGSPCRPWGRTCRRRFRRWRRLFFWRNGSRRRRSEARSTRRARGRSRFAIAPCVARLCLAPQKPTCYSGSTRSTQPLARRSLS